MPALDVVELEEDLEIRPPIGTIMSTVKAQRVRWLWYGRIPLGKITVLDGDPGLGKSQLALDIAARLSSGRPMPYSTGERRTGGVVVLTAEDDLADTVKPRLDAAGAATERIIAIDNIVLAGEEHYPTLPDDLGYVAEAIERVNARLVIIDPLMAYMNERTDSHKDQSVRGMLAPLHHLAVDTGVAVLVVRHLNKMSGTNPLYRGSGSIGIIGHARSGLVVARDPDDPNARVLASQKSNLSVEPESLTFHLEQVDDVSRVVWDGVSEHRAGRLLSESREERSQLEEAKEIIVDALSDGALSAKDLKRRVLAEGVTDHTFRRARSALNLSKWKESGPSGHWMWSLPELGKLPNLPTQNGGQHGQLAQNGGD